MKTSKVYHFSLKETKKLTKTFSEGANTYPFFNISLELSNNKSVKNITKLLKYS